MVGACFEQNEVFEVVTRPWTHMVPLTFFQSCWGIFKRDLMNVFNACGKFEKCLTATFISLIQR